MGTNGDVAVLAQRTSWRLLPVGFRAGLFYSRTKLSIKRTEPIWTAADRMALLVTNGTSSKVDMLATLT